VLIASATVDLVEAFVSVRSPGPVPVKSRSAASPSPTLGRDGNIRINPSVSVTSMASGLPDGDWDAEEEPYGKRATKHHDRSVL
jgi:hypothetical protein